MLLLPLLCLSWRSQPPPPLPGREFRAAWVATVDNIDWPSRRGEPSDQAQREMIAILDRAKAINLNAIVLQVRPAADALYESKIEPWSEFLTGQQGRAPNPYWDPLAFAIQQAHKRGIELHAWFNPFRAWHPASKGRPAGNYIGRTNPELVKKYGPYGWMDPGEPAVQDRSVAVILDVVKRYDLDGVHIDDYFYPYKEKGPNGRLLDFPDDRSWYRYKGGGGKLGRSDWRRKNVDGFIHRLYDGIKAEKRWVKFGISPFGIYRPGYPQGIKAGVDQYADLYADARKWLAEGWCDYFTPQLYWPIHQTAQSYPRLLEWWLKQNEKGRGLWPGNFTEQIGKWPAHEIVDEVETTRKLGAGGNVHFCMKTFMKDAGGINERLKNGPYARAVLAPATPWLGADAPESPIRSPEGTPPDSGFVAWSHPHPDQVRFFAVMRYDGQAWKLANVGSDPFFEYDSGANVPGAVAIYAVSKTGALSQPLVLDSSSWLVRPTRRQSSGRRSNRPAK